MQARTSRHESELGSWELVARQPDPRLRGLVRSYQGYVETGVPDPVRRQELPSTVVPVIVNLGARWEIAAPSGAEAVVDSFVAGLGERSAYVRAAGPAACLQVDFTPLGAHMFFGMPMHELTDRVVGLESALGAVGRSLPERVASAAGWDARFALLDELVAERLAAARAPAADVVWAWRTLERSHGRVRIGALAERLGRSRRHLVARFREHVGLPPKTVARILRFNRALELMGHSRLELAELAFECGYYDQAHLNRDFRHFADTSPTELARRIVPHAGILA